jgi:hypothetical protein
MKQHNNIFLEDEEQISDFSRMQPSGEKLKEFELLMLEANKIIKKLTEDKRKLRAALEQSLKTCFSSTLESHCRRILRETE